MTELTEFLPQQRWFADKSREISEVARLDSVNLDTGGEIQLIGVMFGTGARAIYQLVPELGAGLAEAMATGARLETAQGAFAFRGVEGLSFTHPALRSIGAEQSNTTVVIDDAYAMKVFRKLEAGINPELEMLRFLSARDYPNIAPLRGWYEYEGPTVATTLGVLQDYLPDGHDGWQLALEEIPTTPARFLERAGSLGAATAHLHSTLATDYEDPAFAPDEPSTESMALLRAKIDEDIELMFQTLPELDSLAPIASRGADVRARLAQRPLITTSGRYIRIHGDYHLGQTLARPDGSWILLDFEGEPARPLSERRRKRSALRDVASMLRSFAYAAAAVQRAGGSVPAEFELHARTAFLDSYFADVDQSLLPAGDPAVENLLGIFELEKAIYELRYELNNRPDWVAIPVAGIERLLEAA
jgi:trehalose synthase-fused probable maltokinase